MTLLILTSSGLSKEGEEGRGGVEIGEEEVVREGVGGQGEGGGVVSSMS